jgi:glyoxylase-like metal-dependent hydrolase (beta-lactamase superfamily II)
MVVLMIRGGRRRRLAAALALLGLGSVLLAAYGWHHAGRGPAHGSAAVPRLRPEALTIVPGIHMLGGLSPSAAYAIETNAGLVLVDAGLAPDAGPLKAQLTALGLNWRDVRAILLTHAHGDHSGGAQHLRDVTGAKIYAGRGDAAVLRAGGPREAFYSTFFMPQATTHPTAVDVELTGGEVIEVGNVRVHALAAPGHTPGSICYWLERAGLRVLFSGDVIMELYRDPTTPFKIRGHMLGTYATYLAPRYRGDAAAFLTTLHALEAFPAPDLVLPGHPRQDPEPQSPWMTPERWRTLIDDGLRDMETLVARYQADGADFLDGTPKNLLPELYYLGDFRGAAVYGFFAGARFFVVDAPGGLGLGDFLDQRLRAFGREPAPPTAILLTACGADETAGLSELVARGHVQVVASPEGLDVVRRLCPAGTEVLSAEELPRKGWFAVTPIRLAGRGVAPMAYLVHWRDKTVLFSGRIPIKVNQASGSRLLADFRAGTADVHAYLTTLTQLVRWKPDLWLPAVPADGQNANLYGNAWELILQENWTSIESNARWLAPP